MEGKYANIIIDISHEKIDRPFQYLIPHNLKDKIGIGTCVTVPFGTGNHLRKGYVVEITDQAEYEVSKIKSIADIEDKDITVEADYITLAAWIREQYGDRKSVV